MLEEHCDSIYHAVREEGSQAADAFEQIYAEYYELTQPEME